MIQDIFEFCCYWIAEVGIQFNLSYYAINIIVFCYIEPILTVFMMVSVFLAICNIPINKISIWIFRIIVVSLAIIFCISIPQAIEDFHTYDSPLYFLKSWKAIKEPNPVIIDKFNSAVLWLKQVASKYNTTYEIINILLYIVIMPFFCIISYFILSVHKVLTVQRGEYDCRPHN